MEWKDEAQVAFRAFVVGRKKTNKRKFLFEQFISHAIDNKRIEEPKHPNSWGVLCQWAAREGLIKFTGNAQQASKPSRHGALVREWEAV